MHGLGVKENNCLLMLWIHQKEKNFKEIEVCNPIIKKANDRYFLIFPIRKLIELPIVKDLSKKLNEG